MVDMEGIPSGNLAACPEHGVVAFGNDPCPACATGIEARHDDVLRDITPLDLRWKVEPKTMVTLAVIVMEYLDDVEEGPAWIAVGQLPKGELPAGYTKQERWFNCLRYEFGSLKKTIVQESNAEETIQTLRSEGYGDVSEGGHP